MKKIWKRIISLTLAFAMVIGMMPDFEFKAHAADGVEWTYSADNSETFDEFWKKAYKYSDDNDDCVRSSPTV